MAHTTEKIDAALRELATVRDEIRVRIHLASMEVKDAWAQLEPRLQHIEARLHDVGSAAAGDIGDALQKLGAQFKALRDKLTEKKP
jgi:hypothetical protein